MLLLCNWGPTCRNLGIAGFACANKWATVKIFCWDGVKIEERQRKDNFKTVVLAVFAIQLQASEEHLMLAQTPMPERPIKMFETLG